MATNKPNIFYSVNSKQKNLKEAFDPPIHEIKERRMSMNRATIIICRSYNLSVYFKSSLGKVISEPEGYPNSVETTITRNWGISLNLKLSPQSRDSSIVYTILILMEYMIQFVRNSIKLP